MISIELLAELLRNENKILTLPIKIICIIVFAKILKRNFKIHYVLGVLSGLIPSIIITAYILIPLSIMLLALSCLRIWKKRETDKIQNLHIDDETLLFKTEKTDITVSNIFRSILISGGAGSGKSKSFFIPILRQLVKKNYSGVLYDYKCELSNVIFHYSKTYKSNIKPYFINFKNPITSIRVNPLNPRYMKRTAYAFEYSQTLLYNLAPENIKNPNYFTNDAKSVLTAIIWYLRCEHPDKCTLPHVIGLALYTDIKDLIEKMCENIEVEGMLSSIKEAIKNDAGKQVAGVLSTLKTNLTKINIPELFWILSGNDIDLNINDTESPKLLCIGSDPSLSQTYGSVISLIISSCIKMMNMPDKHKSAIVIDELPTLYIESIDELPAVARSNRISTILGIQDLAQLKLKYGAEKANVILSNMAHQFFGRTTNKETAELVTKLFDKEDRTIVNKSFNESYKDDFLGKHKLSKSKSTNQSLQERFRVKISDLMKLNPGCFYGFVAEGNQKEILKTKFLMDNETIPKYIDKDVFASDDDIKNNYLEIIAQCRDIVMQKKNTINSESIDLIDF